MQNLINYYEFPIVDQSDERQRTAQIEKFDNGVSNSHSLFKLIICEKDKAKIKEPENKGLLLTPVAVWWGNVKKLVYVLPRYTKWASSLHLKKHPRNA